MKLPPRGYEHLAETTVATNAKNLLELDETVETEKPSRGCWKRRTTSVSETFHCWRQEGPHYQRNARKEWREVPRHPPVNDETPSLPPPLVFPKSERIWCL